MSGVSVLPLIIDRGLIHTNRYSVWEYMRIVAENCISPKSLYSRSEINENPGLAGVFEKADCQIRHYFRLIEETKKKEEKKKKKKRAGEAMKLLKL